MFGTLSADARKARLFENLLFYCNISLYRFFSPFNSLRSGLVVFGGTVEDRGAFMRALNNPSVVQ